jgi:hypothetical protein
LIKYAHKLAGHPAPTDDERVKATMRGIRRSIRTAPRKKSPATAERVIAMTPGARTDMKGLRDRALLLFGFAGAFRRSEIVALDSLRAGFLTSAAKRGALIFKMMDQSRHRSVETLRGYVRDADIFKEHAGAGLL